jgi:hypothetical protein
MFIWKNGSFRVVSNNLQISPKFNDFLKKYNANNKVLYICYILEEIEDEYSELLNQKQQMSLQEVYLAIKKEVSKKNSKYNGNPFLLKFLELLAESIPEKATNKKVA